MELNFLDDSFDGEEKGAGEADGSGLVVRLIDVSDRNGVLETGGGDLVLSHKVPVDAGDVCTAVNKGTGVNGFQGVHGGDQLYWDSHRSR